MDLCDFGLGVLRSAVEAEVEAGRYKIAGGSPAMFDYYRRSFERVTWLEKECAAVFPMT